jgi:hypothetical protein
MLKEELADMRSHYERQLETFAIAHQTPAPAAAAAAAPKQPKKPSCRNAYAQTPAEFMPKPGPTVVTTVSNPVPEYERRIQVK